MSGNFELICHHAYSGWNGLPVDLTDYDSHGQAFGTQFLPDGASQGSGAIRFLSLQSRIVVKKSPASESLTGIKVEATVRRTKLLNRVSTLVAGHNSFSFYLVENQLRATFRGKSTHPLSDSDGLDSEGDGVVSPRWTMPVGGRWLKLGFMHDGIDTMEMYVDEQLVARRSGLLASVPRAGPLGLCIGNEPEGNHACFLGGDIDEVKIWRLDPHIMDREFLGRPMGNGGADCWKRFFHSLSKALLKNPDCAHRVDALLKAMVDEVRRSIVAKGPETRDRYIKTCEKYLELWKAGKIDGPEMKKLIATWSQWLELVGFSFADAATVQALLNTDCLTKILKDLPYDALDCDPKFKAFLKLVIKHTPQVHQPS